MGDKMQFAFCLEMLFKDLPFNERLSRAKDEGIRNIEFWDWRDKDLPALAQVLAEHGMRVTNISGNRRYGMIDQSHREPFLQEVVDTAQVAKKLGCSRLMLLVQALRPDGSADPPSAHRSPSEIVAQIVAGGKELAKLSEQLNLEFVIEPLNTVTDHPGYFLNTSGTAFEIIDEIHHPRVKALYDIYHMTEMGENVLRDIERHIDSIGYFHVADSPGRGEPGSGGVRYEDIFALLRRLNYQGIIGFEFSPSNGMSSEAIRKALKVLDQRSG